MTLAPSRFRTLSPNFASMQRSTIIVAGGTGKRMGAAMPKQFLLLKGKPLLAWTIEAFNRYDPGMSIIVVLPEAQIPVWGALCTNFHFNAPHDVVAGGEERFHSVRNGMARVMHDGLVAVHDGVRPLVGTDLIARCFNAAEEYGAAIPVMPITSSVREVQDEGSRAVDRSRLRTVQTPQCFSANLLRRAMDLPYDAAFTDEATLVERLGVEVHLVEGDERNIKITSPLDLQMAEVLLG
jgi:2-C-methyl-D-erythritol 4-phosphate cytidylyltransferase